MGAMDGIHLSNTLFFERAAGWKGLLIEADPVQYAGLAKNRRDSICVHAAVCGRFQTVHYHSASMVGGIFEFMAEEFKERFHKNLTVDMLPAVPCVPLMFILDKFGIGSIDMWSLDVEGAELEVLQTVDFSRLDVKVLVVELHGYDKERDAKVVSLLERAGFGVYKMKKEDSISSLNTVFVHRSAWPHLGGVS